MLRQHHLADAELAQYLHQTLGIDPQMRPCEGIRKVPYFYREAYDLRELWLLKHRVLLAINRRKTTPPLRAIRNQLRKLEQITETPVVFVTAALASYERKQLVDQKVPFIVPGNQLYLPELGIDLREYFRRVPQPPAGKLSPATQAFLITALLRKHWTPEWRPAEKVAELGYTPMTLSRAVRELTAAGIANVIRDGRETWLRMERGPAQIWEQARPLLRSPIRRSVWAHPTKTLRAPHTLLAGLSALAAHTMLAEPDVPTYAVSAAQWKAAVHGGVEELPELAPGAWQWEVWSYPPIRFGGSKTVDPLSLTLSLQREGDERIQLALDKLRKQLPW